MKATMMDEINRVFPLPRYQVTFQAKDLEITSAVITAWLRLGGGQYDFIIEKLAHPDDETKG